MDLHVEEPLKGAKDSQVGLWIGEDEDVGEDNEGQIGPSQDKALLVLR